MITVLQPGLLSTVQDEGRQAFLAFGFPCAGVMDRYAYRMANLLCGNPLNAAVIEMTMLGGSFQFSRACRIAICGANMNPCLNGAAVETWMAMDVSCGDILETGYAKTGCRSYFAVSGGFNVPVVMGSRSTYTRAGVGGIEGRALKKGDMIPVGEMPPLVANTIRLDASFIPSYFEKICLRTILGPQDDLFLPEGIDAFFQSEYEITDEADRMGYRLAGPLIKHIGKADIISDGLGRGAVQVPGSGQPIVMMADCGTTGGYAKIATVIGADLWKLAQAKAQDKVCFLQCSDTEAIHALTEERELYRSAARLVASNPVARSTSAGDIRKMRMEILNQKYQIEIEEVK